MTPGLADDPTVRWLLDGDPSIRWQALRDLVGAPAQTVARERAKVAREGWGARLLGLQDARGAWGGGLYTPKWTSTTYTLLELRDFGLQPGDPRAARACRLLLDGGLQADGGVNYPPTGKPARYSETCITGMVLSLLSYFELDDQRLDTIVEHLLARQMEDGGWNCRLPRGATHASVHTTISVLEGLRLYEIHRRRELKRVREAQQGGREFLLAHRLFRSHRTGEVIQPAFVKLAFPPRWHYDILRALDHFREVGAARDPRLGEAVEIVRRCRGRDGRWPLQNVYSGKTWFQLEQRGRPSRWNTLRALRVLRWWDGDGPR